MAVRDFDGPEGVRWRVWEVVPGRVSNFRSSYGSHLPDELAEGWLCFESRDEKRRLAPLPRDWDERDDADLRLWCRAAEPVRQRVQGGGPPAARGGSERDDRDRDAA